MDKLFLYEPDEMIKKIKVIEPEMREDSYGEITEGLDTTSRNALAYISEIFSYPGWRRYGNKPRIFE